MNLYTLFSEEYFSDLPKVEWKNTRPIQPETFRELAAGPIPDRGNRANGVGSGFPADMERPIIEIDRDPSSSPMFDYYDLGRLSLISAAAKKVFITVDPEAFQFHSAETRTPSGKVGPEYWLCDVRYVDGVDDAASGLLGTDRIQDHGDGVKRYTNLGPLQGELIFKAHAICGAHVFRMMHQPSHIIFDLPMRNAIEAAQITGMRLTLIGGT